GGGFRAQHDEELRGGERGLDLFAEIARSGQLLLVAEDRCQALRNDSVGGQPAGERSRHSEPLDLAMEPVGQLLVLMAVTQEGVVAGLQPKGATRPRMPAGRAVECRQSGKLTHRHAPCFPLTPLTQRDSGGDCLWITASMTLPSAAKVLYAPPRG